ncbi:MAG: MFS transporter [Pseudomonadota bacterium]|nr:MFS transporter [Pseudomonadota bacterium]
MTFKRESPENILRLTRWQTSTFLVMLFGYIGYYLCRVNLPNAFPLLSETFGLTNAELGLIITYSELSYSAGKFVNGPLADKLGGKKFFLLGMIGAIFFNVLFTYGTTLTHFIVIWCFARFFLSMGWGGLVKVIGSWYESKRYGTVMGLISINFQFGGVLAALFSGFLLQMGSDWKGLFLYPAGVLFFILIWSSLASRETPQDVVPGTTFGSSEDQKTHIKKSGSVKENILQLLKMPLFHKLLIFSFFSHVLRIFFFTWTPKLLVDIGMGATTAIFSSAVFPTLGCVGTILLGWYTDKYVKNGDRARPMWIMLLGLAASLFIIAHLMKSQPENLISIVVLIGLCGFFLLGPYSMSGGALSLDIAGPKVAGTCTGLVDGVGYIGGALAGWGAGKLQTLQADGNPCFKS